MSTHYKKLEGAIAQSVELATPGKEALGSIRTPNGLGRCTV